MYMYMCIQYVYKQAVHLYTHRERERKRERGRKEGREGGRERGREGGREEEVSLTVSEAATAGPVQGGDVRTASWEKCGTHTLSVRPAGSTLTGVSGRRREFWDNTRGSAHCWTTAFCGSDTHTDTERGLGLAVTSVCV